MIQRRRQNTHTDTFFPTNVSPATVQRAPYFAPHIRCSLAATPPTFRRQHVPPSPLRLDHAAGRRAEQFRHRPAGPLRLGQRHPVRQPIQPDLRPGVQLAGHHQRGEPAKPYACSSEAVAKWRVGSSIYVPRNSNSGQQLIQNN